MALTFLAQGFVGLTIAGALFIGCNYLMSKSPYRKQIVSAFLVLCAILLIGVVGYSNDYTSPSSAGNWIERNQAAKNDCNFTQVFSSYCYRSLLVKEVSFNGPIHIGGCLVYNKKTILLSKEPLLEITKSQTLAHEYAHFLYYSSGAKNATESEIVARSAESDFHSVFDFSTYAENANGTCKPEVDTK